MSRVVAGSVVYLLLVPQTLSAQPVTVQQPVVRLFGVNTSVSVPDRGGTFLGGVSRAAASRSRFGPFRSGTATGVFRSHGGTTAHVFVHDLEAMDRALLRRGSGNGRRQNGPPLNGYAQHAYQRLQARHERRPHRDLTTGRSGGTRESASDVSPSLSVEVARTGKMPGPSGRAEKFYRLGLRAEERGSPRVARLHYRMAVKYGSEAANEKLAALDE